MLYFATFIFILYSWLIVDVYRCKQLNAVCVTVSLLFLVLIAGLRYRVGGDTLHYVDTYSLMPTFSTLCSIDFEEGYGPLWYLFCAISKFVGEDFVYLQILHACIVNLVFLFFFRKRSVSILASLLIYFVLYYFYYTMEILREALAVCVFCYNIDNLIKKRFIRYYLLSLVAIGFHFSALILLFFPLLYKIAQSRYSNFLFLIIGGVVVVTFFVIVPTSYDLLLDYLPIIALKLKSYSTLSFNNILGICFYAIPFVSFFIIYRISVVKNIQAGNSYVMKIFLLFLFLGSINQGLMRIVNYLVPFAISYIVNVGSVVFAIKGRSIKTQLFFFCGFFLLLFHKSYYYLSSTDGLVSNTRMYELWYPYESVFNPVKHRERELIYYNAMYNQEVMRN